MQFMVDISRSMSKAYADLESNFLSTLTNLVLLRRDAYLRHTHPNLDAFMVRNLCAAPVSDGDLFERSLMQEYEQHLIGLGVKPGSKKEPVSTHIRKTRRVGVDVNKLHKGFIITPCRCLNIWCNNPSFSLHPKVVVEEDMVVAEVMAAEAGQMVTSSSNLLNDTQYQVLPSQNPGIELTMLSEDPLHCVFPVTPPEGEKTLSVLTLPERVKTPCVQSPPEGEKTPCVQPPPEGGKTPCVQTHQRGRKLCVTGYMQTSSVQKCIYSRKSEKPASGGQTEAVSSRVGKTRLPPVDYMAN